MSMIACALAGCGGGGPASTSVSADGIVAPAARWCPEEAGDKGFATEGVVGLPLPKAERLAEKNGCSVRATERDGESLPVTLDINPARINVAVESERVTAVKSLG
jgi:hypothetical protein